MQSGIDMEGHKDALGMYIGENESAKFWLSIVNGLKNVKFIPCIVLIRIIRKMAIMHAR